MEERVISPQRVAKDIIEIQEKAQLGRYRIRGRGAFRSLPTFDDLVIIPAGLTRIPLEGYRETCSTQTILGNRFAKRPMILDIPITIAGMSYGALSIEAKTALGYAASEMGTSTCTGDGGMHPEERRTSKQLVYQYLPSRYGQSPYDLKRADAIEIVVSQGAKPGGGGLLLGQKMSASVAAMRDLPAGIDQRSPVRHPDWLGPDDLGIKIEELREITNWEVPIFVKIGASRVGDDVKLAIKAGADVVVVDGMEGGTAASVETQIEHTGIPTLAAVSMASRAIREMNMEGVVQLVISGGIRTGADVAKALAMGADAVSIGSAALIAMGCNEPIYLADYQRLGTSPGECHHCHTGRCPVGITTQDPSLVSHLDPAQAREKVKNFLMALTMETQMLARACGKGDVHDLDETDLRALTIESALITHVPLVGMDLPLRMV